MAEYQYIPYPDTASTAYGTKTGTDTVNWALQQARDYVGSMTTPDVVSYPTNYQAPVQMGYGPQYQASPEYQMVSGLMGGDYDALETALQQPAYQAYGRNVNDINSAIGANGLYGSMGQGMHSDALAGAGQNLQSALAEATAKRYALQEEDMAAQMQQNAASAQYGMSEAERQSTYDQNQFAWDYSQAQGMTDWYNQQIQDKYLYDVSTREGLMAADQRTYENFLGLAGGSMEATSPLLQQQSQDYATNVSAANQAMKSAADQYAAQLAAQSSAQSSLWGGVGALGGGLLGNWQNIFG
jgi:hypothetical protein